MLTFNCTANNNSVGFCIFEIDYDNGKHYARDLNGSEQLNDLLAEIAAHQPGIAYSGHLTSGHGIALDINSAERS
jgi:hypothetical protein